MSSADSVFFALWSVFFNGFVIWFAKDVKPVILRFLLLLFVIYFMQSSLTNLGKSLGYSFQIADSTKIAVSIVLAWFGSLLDQNNRSASQSNQPKSKTYLDVVTELLQGDRAAAIRLFNYNKEKFGGKTDEWLWQKVIRDIERDRR